MCGRIIHPSIHLSSYLHTLFGVLQDLISESGRLSWPQVAHILDKGVTVVNGITVSRSPERGSGNGNKHGHQGNKHGHHGTPHHGLMGPGFAADGRSHSLIGNWV